MKDEETFTAIALQQGEIDIFADKVRFKLFGRDDSSRFKDSEYYESFLNLDIKDGFTYWNEKDNEYRQPLLDALIQK
jgi:hypothetical protein